jgi:hypothetical protein
MIHCSSEMCFVEQHREHTRKVTEDVSTDYEFSFVASVYNVRVTMVAVAKSNPQNS